MIIKNDLVFNNIVVYSGHADNSYLEFLAEMAQKYKPKSIVEVGIQFGPSLLILGWNAPEGTKLIGIDRNECPFAKAAFKLGGLDVDVIQDIDVNALPYVEAEFVHLDGAHSTEGLYQELFIISSWKNLPKIIVIHDWIDPCVQKAVNQFVAEYNNWQLYVNLNVHNQCATLTLL